MSPTKIRFSGLDAGKHGAIETKLVSLSAFSSDETIVSPHYPLET